ICKNRIYDVASIARCIPKERECWPLSDHSRAGCSGNSQRNAERDEPQNRLYRQLYRLSAHNNRMTVRQVGEMCPLQSQERAVHNEKCARRTSREDFPLKTQCLKEDVLIAERPEPQHVHVIGQRGPTAEDDACENDQNEKEATAARRLGPRPVNELVHCSAPFSSASSLSA